MATSTISLTSQDGTTQQDATSFLMDEANNLSVIFKIASDNGRGNNTLPPALLRENANCTLLRDWADNCKARVATIPQASSGDPQFETRNSMLAAFPNNLHFPIGALFDFANRLGSLENAGPGDRVGLETQAIISGILYLQQQLEQQFAPGTAINQQHLAYSRNESEATWSCYRDLIRYCDPDQNWRITLADENTSYLPIPTLDIRLIIQNVIFAVLDDSNRDTPLAIHVSNAAIPRIGKNCFSLSIKVPGNPLGNVISSTCFRSGKRNTFIFEGSGIGHIVAARLIEYLGGDIIVTNDGVSIDTINILIPLERGVPPPPRKPASIPVWGKKLLKEQYAQTGEFSVLYIEDMKSHAALVKQILERLGNIKLDIAYTATAGLEMAVASKPNLILLDMELPDMNGIELFQRLRANPATCGITVFAISAAAMPHQISQALALGVKHYLTKPFSYKELIQILQEEQDSQGRQLMQ